MESSASSWTSVDEIHNGIVPHCGIEGKPRRWRNSRYSLAGENTQNLDDVLNRPPVWRYMGKDALKSPRVQAVEEFRKVIEEAEKQQQKKP